MKDVDHVNETQEIVEHQLPFRGTDYFMRIVSYRTKERTVKGIIITFVEFAAMKNNECKQESRNEKSKKNC